MNSTNPANATPQGFGASTAERLPVPSAERMTEAQGAAAQAIIDGPRKGLFGPFVPLLQTPVLMEWIGKTGETLRYAGSLPDRLREFAICIVSRETGNQFEWQTHMPLAVKAGLDAQTLATVEAGRHPRTLAPDEACVFDFVTELLKRNGVSDATYAEAVDCFGEAGTVELTTLVGYFVMVCWVMNVARTPGPAGSSTPPLLPFPA